MSLAELESQEAALVSKLRGAISKQKPITNAYSTGTVKQKAALQSSKKLANHEVTKFKSLLVKKQTQIQDLKAAKAAANEARKAVISNYMGNNNNNTDSLQLPSNNPASVSAIPKKSTGVSLYDPERAALQRQINTLAAEKAAAANTEARADIRQMLVNDGITSPNNDLIKQVMEAKNEYEIREIIKAAQAAQAAQAANRVAAQAAQAQAEVEARAEANRVAAARTAQILKNPYSSTSSYLEPEPLPSPSQVAAKIINAAKLHPNLMRQKLMEPQMIQPLVAKRNTLGPKVAAALAASALNTAAMNIKSGNSPAAAKELINAAAEAAKADEIDTAVALRTVAMAVHSRAAEAAEAAEAAKGNNGLSRALVLSPQLTSNPFSGINPSDYLKFIEAIRSQSSSNPMFERILKQAQQAQQAQRPLGLMSNKMPQARASSSSSSSSSSSNNFIPLPAGSTGKLIHVVKDEGGKYTAEIMQGTFIAGNISNSGPEMNGGRRRTHRRKHKRTRTYRR